MDWINVQVEGEIITVPFSFKCRKLLAELLEILNVSNSTVVQASFVSDIKDLTEVLEMLSESVSNLLSIKTEIKRVIKGGQTPDAAS